MTVSYEKYLLHYLPGHMWISVKSCLGFISTTSMIMTPDI